MEAIRQIKKVKNGKITIQLPKEFNEQKVEVIVLSTETNKKSKRMGSSPKPELEDDESWRKMYLEKLLSVSVWSDKDIAKLEEARKELNEWKLPEL